MRWFQLMAWLRFRRYGPDLSTRGYLDVHHFEKNIARFVVTVPRLTCGTPQRIQAASERLELMQFQFFSNAWASTTEGLMITVPAETECEDLHGYDPCVLIERVVLNRRWHLERHVSQGWIFGCYNARGSRRWIRQNRNKRESMYFKRGSEIVFLALLQVKCKTEKWKIFVMGSICFRSGLKQD